MGVGSFGGMGGLGAFTAMRMANTRPSGGYSPSPKNDDDDDWLKNLAKGVLLGLVVVAVVIVVVLC